MLVHGLNKREGKVGFGGLEQHGGLLASQLENNALSRNLRRVGGGSSSSTPGNCQTHSHQMRGNTESSLGDLYISL